MNYADITIEELGFSVGTFNTLDKHGVKNLGQLLELGYDELTSFQGMTRVKYNEISAYVSGIKDFELTPEEVKETTLSNDSESILTINSSIWMAGFSLKTFNALKRNNILTFSDLMKLTDEDLLNVGGLTNKSVREIHNRMERILALLEGKDLKETGVGIAFKPTNLIECPSCNQSQNQEVSHYLAEYHQTQGILTRTCDKCSHPFTFEYKMLPFVKTY